MRGAPGLRVGFVVVAAAFLLVAGCSTPTGGGGGTSGGGTPGNNPPNAVALASPVSGQPPMIVNFDGSLSSDNDGDIVSWDWDWDDGTPHGNGPTPTHTFTGVGTFHVLLTVTDDGGAWDQDVILIATELIDNDGDGYNTSTDCNDSDQTVHPDAADPTGDNIDSNCDDIDGVDVNSIYVRETGTDNSDCGLTKASPCATIGHAQIRAGSTNRKQVLVAGGSYPPFALAAGLEVRGGYGQNFRRPGQVPAPTAPTVTGIAAAYSPSIGAPVGITVNGIDTPAEGARLADLTVVGAVAAAGQSSYGIVITNSNSALVLDTVKVLGGQGAPGNSGGAGTSSAGTAAGGANGQNSHEAFVTCDTEEHGNGGNGAGGGGKGGNGGERDSDCSFFGYNYDATPGDGGAAGSGGGGAGGGGGSTCNNGGNGSPGGVVDGTPGSAGVATNGTLSGGFWAISGGTGGTGGLGQAGKPGGGGGGGGGCDEGTDDWGAGGGGGGAGGAAATAGGTGGTAGRASIAIFLDNASPTFISVQVTLGKGGAGGAGGTGGTGQGGGPGGFGGLAHCNSDGPVLGSCVQTGNGGGGGNGGAGGRGGHSGGGGGGAGGPAIGIVRHNSLPSGSVSYSGGTGGPGGSGGGGPLSGTNGQVGLVTFDVVL